MAKTNISSSGALASFAGDVGGDLLASVLGDAGGAIAGKLAGGTSAGGLLLTVAYEYAKFTVEVARATNQFNSSIKDLSFSELSGQRNTAFIRDEIGRLGLSVDEGRKNYEALTGAVVGTSLEGNESNKVFTNLSLAAKGMNLDTEQSSGMFKSLGRILREGVLDEDGLQRLEQSFKGAREAMQQASGLSSEDFKAGVQNRTLSADYMVSNFASTAQQLYAPNPDQLANTSDAKTNRFLSEGNRFNTHLGEAFDWDAAMDQLGTSFGDIGSSISKHLHLDSVADWGSGLLKSFNDATDRDKFVDQSIKKYANTGTSRDAYYAMENGDELHGVAYHVQSSIQKASASPLAAKQEKENLQNYFKYYDQQRIKLERQYTDRGYPVPQGIKTYYSNLNAVINNGIDTSGKYQTDLTAQENKNKIRRQGAVGPYINGVNAGTAGQQKNVQGQGPLYGGFGTSVNNNSPSGQAKVINIGKLADITIRTTNLPEGAAQVRDILTKELMEVLTDAN